MPLAFPSHQGLILPVARRWPAYFDGLALCVGAAVPDVVDGSAGLLARGYAGQGLGHSLVGVVLLCWPAGIVLTWLLAGGHGRLRRDGWRTGPRVESALRVMERATGWPAPPALRRPRWLGTGRAGVWSLSVVVGALSHLLTDCLSHDHCPCLYPWLDWRGCYPAWWGRAWFYVPLPLFKDPYPFAPHTVAWCALSVIGAVLFFRPPREPRRSGVGSRQA